jgi:hypothetical protein
MRLAPALSPPFIGGGVITARIQSGDVMYIFGIFMEDE